MNQIPAPLAPLSQAKRPLLLYPWHRVSHLPLPLHPECARRVCIEGRTRPPLDMARWAYSM